jgi:hypothetical protein
MPLKTETLMNNQSNLPDNKRLGQITRRALRLFVIAVGWFVIGTGIGALIAKVW